jgi:hypothetical protein
MRDKCFFEGMSELEEISGGVLAVPVPKEEREAVFEETRKAIELMRHLKWVPFDFAL